MLIPDLEDFVQNHRSHGQLVAEAGTPGPNGYRLEVRCDCRVVFERWVTPEDAGVELTQIARAGTDLPDGEGPSVSYVRSAAGEGLSRRRHLRERPQHPRQKPRRWDERPCEVQVLSRRRHQWTAGRM
jgi:hypothetical protein